MGRKGSRHRRAGPDHRLLADLDAAQDRHVGGDPAVIPDPDGLDGLRVIGVEVVLIRVEDAGSHADPDPVADLDRGLCAQMAAVQEPLPPDPDVGAGESEDQNRRDVRAKPGVVADLDPGPLGDRERRSV
jgi:hypothetical protein